MTKDASLRFQDTLTFIRNSAELTNLVRQEICVSIMSEFPRLPEQDNAKYNTLSEGMSISGNLGRGVKSGNANERELRRAIFLLWSAMGSARQMPLCAPYKTNADAAMTLAPPMLAAAYREAMRVAGLTLSHSGLERFLIALRDDTVNVLKTYKLLVGGNKGGAKFSNPINAPPPPPPPPNAPPPDWTNEAEYFIHYDPGLDRVKIDISNHDYRFASLRITACSVPAIYWQTVPQAGAHPCDFSHLLGTELRGHDWMFQTQFTGCSFVWTMVNGVYRVMHVSPAGPTVPAYTGGGKALATRLKTQGRMENAGNAVLNVFGNGDGNATFNQPFQYYELPINRGAGDYVTIFGVRHQDDWQFYFQTILGANIARDRTGRFA